MQNKSIQVRGLQKSYKDLHVLKGVDFEVEKGSIFALLGSNGAGKTTIVRILRSRWQPIYFRQGMLWKCMKKRAGFTTTLMTGFQYERCWMSVRM